MEFILFSIEARAGVDGSKKYQEDDRRWVTGALRKH
jgi:hypothetical protein